MPYFIVDMVGPQGNEVYDLCKFASLDEARAHTLTPSFTSANMGCVIKNVSIWNPQHPVFEFDARDPQGQLITDIIECPSQDEARIKIQDMGYTVTRIEFCNIAE